MKVVEITSATNPQFKVFKSLLTAKGIKEQGLFLLSGEKLISEFLENPPKGFQVEFVLFDEELKIQLPFTAPQAKDSKETEDAKEKAGSCRVKQTRLARELFRELDILGTHFNLLVLSFKEFQTVDTALPFEDLQLICPLGDPRNLGSLARTALAFGAKNLILTAEAAHPYLPQSIKASAGAVLHVQFLKALKKLTEIPLVGENLALHLHGTPLHQTPWPQHFRLWVGEEGPGLQLTPEQKRQMKFITIPTESVESLNAGTAMSLALWEWKKSFLVKK